MRNLECAKSIVGQCLYFNYVALAKIFVGLISLHLIILIRAVFVHIFISSIGKQMTDNAEATTAGDVLDQDGDTPVRW